MNNNRNFIYQFAIFLFSLIGVFLTFHMHFLTISEQDCQVGGCTAMFNSLSPLGISNVYWGMLFYISISMLSLISSISNDKRNKIIISIRNYLISFGFIYSILLVLYQFNIGFCKLCLISAIISAILFILILKIGFKNTSFQINQKNKYLYPSSIFAILLFITIDSINYKQINTNEYNQITIKDIKHDYKVSSSKTGSVLLGDSEAKVTIVKWTDFQ